MSEADIALIEAINGGMLFWAELMMWVGLPIIGVASLVVLVAGIRLFLRGRDDLD